MEWEGLLRRLSLALLCGFVSFLLTWPVACGGLLLYSEHLNGDVQSGGPESIILENALEVCAAR
jgi:hypothetical protein